MGTSGRPSMGKRQKEQVRAERQREKAQKRQQRKIERQNPPATPPSDIEEIVGVSEVPTDKPAEPTSP